MKPSSILSILPFVVAVGAPALVWSQAKTLPVRSLVSNAGSTEEFTAPAGVRELPDGRVVVLDVSEKRVVILDAALKSATQLGRQGSGPGEYQGAIFLIRGRGDSLLLGDMVNQRLLAIAPNGKFAGQTLMAEKLNPLALAGFYIGTPTVDARGRIVFQGTGTRVSTSGQIASDSLAPVLRLTLATRALDTLAYVRVAAPRMTMSGDMKDPSTVKMSIETDPFPTIDDWVLLADGTLAVLRGSDYHVDWIAADGKKTSSAPIPYDRQPVTAEMKQNVLGNSKKADSIMNARMGSMGGGRAMPRMAPTMSNNWPDFLPVFPVRMAMAAPDGNIWVLAKLKKGAPASKTPYLYDVIGRSGAVIGHVALPKDRSIVGFGKNSVYLAFRDDDDIVRIERAPLK